MIVIRNLTELIKYQETQKVSHYYELLTATVSHEMLTPLNSILTFLAQVLSRVEDQYLQKQLRIISSSSHMLHYLVSDLIDLF
jgi:signal transduction histidine kinase